MFEFAMENEVQKGDLTWAKSQDSVDLDHKLGLYFRSICLSTLGSIPHKICLEMKESPGETTVLSHLIFIQCFLNLMTSSPEHADVRGSPLGKGLG